MSLIDFILHVDQHLLEFVRNYGVWIYGLLFLIIFVETGLVVMPFLPGDSMLFAAGAIAATGAMNPELLCVLLIIAGVLGNTVNYHVGRFIGPRVFEIKSRFINQQQLQKTHQFFEHHGGKTIIFTRFMPIIRTLAPFVAGVGKMTYTRFQLFNIVGAVAWVVSFIVIGYLFGNQPMVKKNFTYVIFAIIIISFLPSVIAYLRQRMAKSSV